MPGLIAVFKPHNLPTLSLDCADPVSLEGLLAAARRAQLKPGQGLKANLNPRQLAGTYSCAGTEPVTITPSDASMLRCIKNLGQRGSDAATSGANGVPVSATPQTELDVACLVRELEQPPASAAAQLALPEQGLLHRLDNATSGWVLAATNERTLAAYRQLRQAELIEPVYAARCLLHPLSDLRAHFQAFCERGVQARNLRSRFGVLIDIFPEPLALEADAPAAPPRRLVLRIKSGLEQRGDRVFVHPTDQFDDVTTPDDEKRLTFWSAEAAPRRSDGATDPTNSNSSPSRREYQGGRSQLGPVRTSLISIDVRQLRRCLSTRNEVPLDVQCTFARGMRHQLRAHLAAVGLPLLHDDLYGLTADHPGQPEKHDGKHSQPALQLSCIGYHLRSGGRDNMTAQEDAAKSMTLFMTDQ
ncbi:uncharacterized protein MONBRDRAFT_7794 [Monosiga brevicollis MX1]|uniref:Pseudouridine synthase RsuA/RluA-like domain-containing protein n=1 Tax=Monosiga brevicollis TaxID=81824 RepID=A9UXF5_MONBE|nr:uncharacterized protein MONBRDRAFT_7794 [Monosiga brevicollis MX1]EDQ89997.1 predicted protein [Monosiga brevicollis MX1]|eukprot:XP_001745419.1 hypothetical protein [Monosiga brevicollis MX1]